MRVAVGLGVLVDVAVLVLVRVSVAVGVFVLVLVAVGLGVLVRVAVGLDVGVGVGSAQHTKSEGRVPSQFSLVRRVRQYSIEPSSGPRSSMPRLEEVRQPLPSQYC